MKFIDLFSGVGGFTRGLELAGHECIGHCELDKFAEASYRSMHTITEEQRKYLLSLPLKQRQKEILKEEYLNGEWYESDIKRARNIPRADIWTFGAPCQDFSIAGRRTGLDGGRSSLVREVFRLLGERQKEDRPEWIIYENVRGMLSSNRGEITLKSSLHWMNLGTMSSGKILTQNGSHHKIGSAYTLSDILEDEVDAKYFLSREQAEKIILNS